VGNTIRNHPFGNDLYHLFGGWFIIVLSTLEWNNTGRIHFQKGIFMGFLSSVDAKQLDGKW
jgi:hypothetical protein